MFCKMIISWMCINALYMKNSTSLFVIPQLCSHFSDTFRSNAMRDVQVSLFQSMTMQLSSLCLFRRPSPLHTHYPCCTSFLFSTCHLLYSFTLFPVKSYRYLRSGRRVHLWRWRYYRPDSMWLEGLVVELLVCRFQWCRGPGNQSSNSR